MSVPASPWAAGLALFDTAIGSCGIAWTGHGVAGVQLPEADARATQRRLAGSFPGVPCRVPPAEVAGAIAAIAALLRGDAQNLVGIVLDLQGVSEFERCVYRATRRIARGSTLTYGELAREIGLPGAARAVGQALGRNPYAPVVPCHRVLAAGGRPGGFSAHGGLRTKLRLLEIEGAPGFGRGGLFGPPSGAG
jgi:methylated-DNA-[protein]-cysteine S-methyltransferase